MTVITINGQKFEVEPGCFVRTRIGGIEFFTRIVAEGKTAQEIAAHEYNQLRGLIKANGALKYPVAKEEANQM